MSPPAGPASHPGGEAAARDALRRAGAELYASALVGGRAGNLSVRLDDRRLLVTASGCRLGRLAPDDLVTVAAGANGDRDPPGDATSELPLHLALYRARDDVAAVVHTHAPALTAAGLRGFDIGGALPEVGHALGGLAVVERAPSGSDELARRAARAVLRGPSVLLLRGHGAVAAAGSLDEALARTELAELAAYAVLLSRETGIEVDLNRLADLHRRCRLRLEDRAGGAAP